MKITMKTRLLAAVPIVVLPICGGKIMRYEPGASGVLKLGEAFTAVGENLRKNGEVSGFPGIHEVHACIGDDICDVAYSAAEDGKSMQIRIDPFEGCPSGEHEVRVQFECHDAEGVRDSVSTDIVLTC